ncbi:choice-of-anchor D domain-containing protein, partial [bacterium]|nr:choice-of-anchor D domain-containing protein [candidate division CSSED10-310 bacterium]
GTLNSFDWWKHETLEYYIYNHVYSGDGINYWNIDSDTDDAHSYYYVESTVSPPVDLSWNVYEGTGTVSVTEYSLSSEIQLQGNHQAISDGDNTPTFKDYTHFGTFNVSSGSMVRTFKIHNTGAGSLSLTGSSPYINIGGTNPGDFSVTSAPSNSIATNDSTSFQITFDPAGEGDQTATISIANDDSDENPYDFTIMGRGAIDEDLLVAGITNPSAANGNYIYQGLIFDFEYWKHETLDYYIFNDDYDGIRYWEFDVDTDDSDTDFLFYFESEAATPKGLSGWVKNTVGSIAGDPIITTGGVTAPEINIQGNMISIIDGDATPSIYDHSYFGSLNVSSGTRTRTFTIHNYGSAALTLTGTSPYVSISGTNSADFSITTPPAAVSIATGDSTTFTVAFDPSASGTRNAALSIANNDDDENPYHFNIQGEGITPRNLLVSGIITPADADGTYVHQGILYEYQYWKHATLDYYIYNDDFEGTRYWDLDTDTDDAASLFYSQNNSEAPSPVSVTSWHVETGNEGTPVMSSAEPEINVLGDGTGIADGGSYDYGTKNTGSNTDIIFTIENTGNSDLTLSGSPIISITGDNADQFSVQGSQPTSPVSVSGSTTFTIRFSPTSAGAKTAAIAITNNDGDENPYHLTLNGTGSVSITFTHGANAALDFQQVNASISDNDWLCGQFSLAGNATGATLNSVTVTLGGTYDTGDLQSTPFQLYANSSNTFAGASPVGSSVSDPGSGLDVIFSSLSDAIPSGMRYYWVTADISASATADDNMNATIDASGDLSISGGALNGSSVYGKLNAGDDASLPVILSSFSAESVAGDVLIQWLTESEVNNLGFILERAVQESPLQWDEIASYQTHSELQGQGNTSSQTEYQFNDENVQPGVTYSYRLSDVSTKGDVNILDVISVTLDNLPEETAFLPAFPNPFNPQTKISYQLAESGRVEIAVYDLLGRKVSMLLNEEQRAGSYNIYWHGKDDAGRQTATGTYILQLIAGDVVKSQKVLLMR